MTTVGKRSVRFASRRLHSLRLLPVVVPDADPYRLAPHRIKRCTFRRMIRVDARGERVPFSLARLRPADVDGYISRRRAEGTADTTIAKELVVLRKSLRLAIRAGQWRGRVEEVIPVAFSPGYEPRKRALTAAPWAG